MLIAAALLLGGISALTVFFIYRRRGLKAAVIIGSLRAISLILIGMLIYVCFFEFEKV